MVEVLALEIKNYGLSKNYEIDDIVYESLAWVGLHNTKAYTEKDIDEKELIQHTIGSEITNFTPFSYGKPCE